MEARSVQYKLARAPITSQHAEHARAELNGSGSTSRSLIGASAPINSSGGVRESHNRARKLCSMIEHVDLCGVAHWQRVRPLGAQVTKSASKHAATTRNSHILNTRVSMSHRPTDRECDARPRPGSSNAIASGPGRWDRFDCGRTCSGPAGGQARASSPRLASTTP